MAHQAACSSAGWAPAPRAAQRRAGGREWAPVGVRRSTPRCHRPHRPPAVLSLAAAQQQLDGEQAGRSSSQSWDVGAAKRRLLAAIEGTERGAAATPLQRGEVEEAQVALEGCSPPELDFALLEGKWRLLYSTAADVVPLVRPQLSLGPLPLPFQAGGIYQRFSSLELGKVENIIELQGLPLPLLEGCTATAVVTAAYEQRTPRSIALTFREAALTDVQPGPDLQNLIATPLLPRGQLQMQALQALRQIDVRLPLATRLPGTSSDAPRPRGINYQLSFLDKSMLIGRAQGSGGAFIFQREHEPLPAAPLEAFEELGRPLGS